MRFELSSSFVKATKSPEPCIIPSLTCDVTTPNPTFLSASALEASYLKKSIAFQLFCIPSIILSNLIPPSFIKTIFLIIKQLKIYLFKLKKEF